jgi:nicotinate-nucleotide adenylyltransferase
MSELLKPAPSCELGVFGGTFDPPHQGHVQLIRRAMQDYSLRVVVVALTTQNPFKSRRATSMDLRYEMLDRVLRFEGFAISESLEGAGVLIWRKGYEYTVDLVEELRGIYQKPFAWIIGEDLVNEVHRWKRFSDMQLPFIVVPEVPGFRSTEVREGRVPPHPAIETFVKEKKLYQED